MTSQTKCRVTVGKLQIDPVFFITLRESLRFVSVIKHEKVLATFLHQLDISFRQSINIVTVVLVDKL